MSTHLILQSIMVAFHYMKKEQFPLLSSQNHDWAHVLYSRMKTDIYGLDTNDCLSILKPKIDHCVGLKEVRELMQTPPSSWRIKYGIDPTGTQIHLGHLAPLFLVRVLHRIGAHVDIVIGDFTARVGDPSGRSTARPLLTEEQIEKNWQGYTTALTPYFDITSPNITLHRNSTWIERDFPLSKILAILKSLPLSILIQREDIRTRITDGGSVSFAEALYPVLMGIDSITLRTTLEIGGRDQELNFWICRAVQRAVGMDQEYALCTPIIEGTSGDGRKMSKSFNNYISADASGDDIFGLVMSTPDETILKWWPVFGEIFEYELEALKRGCRENPLEAKKQLGMLLVSLRMGGIEHALHVRSEFERKFSKRVLYDDDYIPVSLKKNELLITALCSALPTRSKSEWRRLIEQHAVKKINKAGYQIMDETMVVSPGDKIQVGKRERYFFK